MNVSPNSSAHRATTPERNHTVRSARVRRILALSVVGAAAAALAACGSSSAASSTSSTTPTSSTAGRGGPGGAGGFRQAPGASGTIAAINGASLEVQNPTTGQTTVTYTPATTFEETVPASATSVTVGSCISAFGKPTTASSSATPVFGAPVTATTVSISQPTSGTCTGGFGGGGGGFGGGTGTRPPGEGSGTRPGGGAFRRGAGGFGGASGSVSAVNGSTVTVSETNPRTNATSSGVVTLTSSTTFTERMTASSTDLAVGKCANAIGTAGTTGAVTARSIVISTPGANGCTTGFARFGAGGAGAAGGGGA